MIAAVFDVDRTLLPDTTAERLFLSYLVKERAVGARALFETLRFMAVKGRTNPVMATRRHRPYLRGARVELITDLGARCFEEKIRPRISRRGVERVQHHLRDGHQPVLLSGSIPQVIRPLADALGVEHVICSNLEARRDRFTGRLIGPHPYGGGKVLLIQRFANEFKIELQRSFCYADHHSDEPVLSLFGHPVCINPNERLRLIAQRLGWPIEEFR
jgi:putative phosphoserine phosphatase/1-acylglycerol-3-phosphate O-acyltransferase